MGAVDLVIQVESPKSVARGMQRVGRAGHELGAVSKGRIFPKFRSDLLECAVVAKRMRTGEIEETVIPRNPLDVLAQQIVAMVADEEWDVDEIERVVKSAEPYGDLSREQLENVLDMLDGRYPSERFAELRPRIVWDRTAGTVRGRKGARQLAVTNAGTIPDRGLFGVHLPDGRRVGELDEEMVYEARAGQVFLLGASSWRIEEITRDRVIVTPAPGVPGAIPFWRGEGIGRPVELGRAIGEFSREAVATEPEELAEQLRPRRARRREPRRLPARAAGRDEGRPLRSDDRHRALPRRDRRLAALRPLAVRRPRPRRLGTRARGEDPRRARARGGCDLVRRRHRHPSARLRSGSGVRPRPARARRGRGPDRRRALRLGPVRRPLPRGRRPVAADPPRLPRQAHPALAAAAQVAVAARGGQGLPALPGHARDLPRGPPRRPRPAGARRDPPRPEVAAALARRGRDEERVAVRLVAAVRLRRDLHVRGRHAERRAPRRRPGARPRPAPRAARPGGAARADRPGRARRRRGLAPAPHRAGEGGRPRPAPGDPATARRPRPTRRSPSGSPRATRRSRCSRSSRPSAAPCRCGSPARSAGSPPRTAASTATRSASPCPPGSPTPSSRRSTSRWRRCCAATPAPTSRSRPRRPPGASASTRPRP